MILKLKETIASDKAEELAQDWKGFRLQDGKDQIIVLSSSIKDDKPYQTYIQASYPMTTDIQLASRDYRKDKREINLGFSKIGGSTGNAVVITGPCSIESEEQIREVAAFCVKQGIQVMRAGCFKPRTSPYSFQGMGLEGLKLMRKTGDEFNLKIITEVRDATHVDAIIEYSDIVQIGAKAMYDQGILRACAQIQKPVLLKRGFATSLQEFVQAAEFMLSGGNLEVILCERGIRTFETKTRFTLDLCGVSWLKQHTNLPIILDPSHALGYRYGIVDLSKACIAIGIDGLLIETHPNPEQALSDAAQQLNFDMFRNLQQQITPVASAVGTNLV